jgi:hypothetical protein
MGADDGLAHVGKTRHQIRRVRLWHDGRQPASAWQYQD